MFGFWETLSLREHGRYECRDYNTHLSHASDVFLTFWVRSIGFVSFPSIVVVSIQSFSGRSSFFLTLPQSDYTSEELSSQYTRIILCLMNAFDRVFFKKYLHEGEDLIEICHRHFVLILDDICVWILL